MRTRLLHIIWEGLGGTERGVLDLTRHLNPEKYDISVAILGRGGCITDEIDRSKIRVLEFACRSGIDMQRMRCFYAFLISNRFDIVVNHQGTIIPNVALLTLRPRPMLVYHEHGGDLVSGSVRIRCFYAFFRRFYDVYIAIDQDTRQRMVRAGGVPAEKLVTIQNPVDIRMFKPASEREPSLATWNGKATIGTVARLVPQKDLPLFLQTARILAARHRDIQFVIVGDGPLREWLESEAKSVDLNGRLTIIGETFEVPKLLRSFDLFFFTSREEAFGRTLIESLACGVPVLATLPNVGGARELVERLPGVRLVRQREAEVLASAALDLLENPGNMYALGRIGREYVVNHYALEDWVSRMDALYQGLLCTRAG